MSGRVSEVISPSYRINENALRDLDAIVRNRCEEIVPSPKLTYKVTREDNFSYPTDNVADIINERNTPQTKITSVTLEVSHGDAIELKLQFSLADGIVIDATAEDRAKLSLLASDLRNLVRDEMGARGGKRGRSSNLLLRRLPAIPLACGLFVVIFLLSAVAYRIYKEPAYSAAEAQYDQQVETELREFDAKAGAAKASNETNVKIDFLIDLFVSARHKAAEGDDSPVYGPYPWILGRTSFTIGIVIAGVIGWFVILFVIPNPERLFLFGDQIARQQRRDKRRSQVIWGVLIAFLVGVASSIAASAIL